MLPSNQPCAVSQPEFRDCLKDATIVQLQGHSRTIDDGLTAAKIPNDKAERDDVSLLELAGFLGVDKRLRRAGIDPELDCPVDDPPIESMLGGKRPRSRRRRTRLEEKDRREEQGYAPAHRTDGVTHPIPPAREKAGKGVSPRGNGTIGTLAKEFVQIGRFPHFSTRTPIAFRGKSPVIDRGVVGQPPSLGPACVSAGLRFEGRPTYHPEQFCDLPPELHTSLPVASPL